MSEVVIYTDASHHQSTKDGFFAYRIHIPRYDIEIVNSGSLGKIGDWNEGEAKTILLAIEHLVNEGWPLITEKTTIVTDSDFAHTLYKNVKKLKSGVRGRFKGIYDRFCSIVSMWKSLHNLQFVVVKGHANQQTVHSQMNRWCDLECRRQRKGFCGNQQLDPPCPRTVGLVSFP